MYVQHGQIVSVQSAHTSAHTLKCLIFGWTVPLRPLTLTLKAQNSLLRPWLRVAPGQKHYSEVKVIWVQNVCWRESLQNPHALISSISRKKNNTTVCMFLMAMFQFLREKTQLTTTFITSFKHIITLISCFSSCFIFITISSPQWWGVVNHNNVLAKHNGKSVVLIMRIEHREQSRLCLCRLFEGERKKKTQDFSVDYWGIVGIS